MLNKVICGLLVTLLGLASAEAQISGATVSGADIGNPLQAEITAEQSTLGVKAHWVAGYGVSSWAPTSPTNVFQWADLTGNHVFTGTPTLFTSNGLPVVSQYFTNLYGGGIPSLLFGTNDLSQLKCQSIAGVLSSAGQPGQKDWSILMVANTPYAGNDQYTLQFGNSGSSSANQNTIALKNNPGATRQFTVTLGSSTNTTAIVSNSLFGGTDMGTNRPCIYVATFNGTTGDLMLFCNNTNNAKNWNPQTNSSLNQLTLGIRSGQPTTTGRKYIGSISEIIVADQLWTGTQVTNAIHRVGTAARYGGALNNFIPPSVP